MFTKSLISLFLTLALVLPTSVDLTEVNSWQDDLAQATIFSLEMTDRYWREGSLFFNDHEALNITVRDGHLFMTSIMVNDIFPVSRRWNSEDQDSIVFVTEYAPYISIMMAIGQETCSFTEGEEFSIPAPYVSMAHQRVPAYAISHALGLKYIETDSFFAFGDSETILEKASASDLALLKEAFTANACPEDNQAYFRNDEQGRNYLIKNSTITDGINTYTMPPMSIVSLTSEGIFFYEETTRVLHFFTFEHQELQFLCFVPEEIEMGYSRFMSPFFIGKEKQLIVPFHNGGATMGGSTIYKLIDGKLEQFYNTYHTSIYHSDEHIYLNTSIIATMGSTLSSYNMTTEETISITDGFHLVTDFVHYANDKAVARIASTEEMLYFDSMNKGSLYYLDLKANTQEIITPGQIIEDFRVINDKVVYQDSQTGDLWLASLQKEFDPFVLADLASFVRMADTIYDETLFFLDEHSSLFRLELRENASVKLITTQKISSFKTIPGGVLAYTTNSLPQPCLYHYENDRGFLNTIYRGFVQDYSYFSQNNKIIVIPAIAEAEYLAFD